MAGELPSLAPPIILHVDLDCFYAAVEQVRLGIPPEQPLAVQQWHGLIAVNYPARAAGVARHDRVLEALRKCPSLHLVHVETIGDDEHSLTAARRDTAKVSLERYRQASKYVFDIFHQHADVCERASIDEAYLDVTKKVESLIEKRYDWDKELEHLSGSKDIKLLQNASMIVENGPIEVGDPLHRRLLVGAIIAEQIRNDVKCKSGYTCSVGIATNKLLAKIASARHKPNKQTLILPNALAEFMSDLPLKKVKLLGGKIGQQLFNKWGCETAGDVQKIPIEHLITLFGNRLGNYLFKAVRGIYEDKVQEKQTTKSMLAAKSFQATDDICVIRKWLAVLSEELASRMLSDAKENNRLPQNLQLYYRSGFSQQSGDHSKSCNMPHAILQQLRTTCFGTSRAHMNSTETSNVKRDVEGECNEDVLRSSEESDKGVISREAFENDTNNGDETMRTLSDLLQQASFQLFKRIEDPFPCTRLAIAASGFQETQLQGYQSISHFFQNANQRLREVSAQCNDNTGGCLSKVDQGVNEPKEQKHSCDVSGFQNLQESTESADADSFVDLRIIDVTQQQRILNEIYATRVADRGLPTAPKHRKLNSSGPKSVQETLSKYFHCKDKRQ